MNEHEHAEGFWEARGRVAGVIANQPFGEERDRGKAERFRRRLRSWTRSLMLRAGALPANHLLDLGCGVGDVAEFLAADAREITALDGSTTMLAQARARLAKTSHQNWRVQHQNLAQIASVPANVDLIYVGAVGMYLSDDEYRQLLRTIARDAAPGVCVVEREYVSMNGGMIGVIERGDYKSYRRTVQDYLALARSEGFTCVLRRRSSDMYIDHATRAAGALGRWLAALLRPIGRLVSRQDAGSATFILRRAS